MVILKEELLEMLNFKGMQYEYRVSMILDYIKQPEIAPSYINDMIDSMKRFNSINALALTAIFQNKLKNLILGTATCPNTRVLTSLSAQLLIKSQFIVIAAQLNKAGKRLKIIEMQEKVEELKVEEPKAKKTIAKKVVAKKTIIKKPKVKKEVDAKTREMYAKRTIKTRATKEKNRLARLANQSK